jgi:hypothetical protein
VSDHFHDIEKFRRPEMILSELIKKYARGEVAEEGGSTRFMYRAVVLAVDEEGGRLSGPQRNAARVEGVGLDGRVRSYGTILGPVNPRNSAKVVVIDSGHDSFYSEDDARVVWPMFPPDQISMPVSPGEHVYVVFEDASFGHGLWMFRVSGHDSANFMPGSEYYGSSSGRRDLAAIMDGQAEPDRGPVADTETARVTPRRSLSGMFGD